ncbi:MAG: SulP family inorganic anion transporter, partial [Thiotrichales bacterium]
MSTSSLLFRWFPFLTWFPVNSLVLRGDLIAGVTGALVLVPKAMAYAQLSGLPVYFGLYVALVPAILGALWGSSRQLATGPVAIVSLMTAAAITPFAVPFSEEFIGLALLLALMVGVIQLGLGVFKLGVIVNFVSHPVILGFMNAAAIIIALSQVDMLLGIPKGRSDSFLYDIGEMFRYLPDTHLPTLAMSVFALVLMLGLKKIPALSKLSVLVAVVVTIVVSALIGFEHMTKATPDHIADPAARAMIGQHLEAHQRLLDLGTEATGLSAEL